MPYKHVIFSFLLALALSPSPGFGQSSDAVVNNTSIRGLQSFQGGVSVGGNSPAARFGAYASGINFSAPPRTSSNPLAGSRGFQNPRSAPARDLRMSSGPLNYRAASTRLTNNIPPRSGLMNQTASRLGNRLAIQRPVRPLRRIQPNRSALAGASSQAFGNSSVLSQSNRWTSNSPLTTQYGLNSRKAFGGLTSASRRPNLASPKSRTTSALSLSQRGFQTTSPMR